MCVHKTIIFLGLVSGESILLKSNPIYVLNCGGLCNRLNNFINGIYVSRIFNRPLVLYWPVNRACQIRFDQLFDSEIQVEYFTDWEPKTISDYNEIVGKQCICYKKEWQSFNHHKKDFDRFRKYSKKKYGNKLIVDIKANQFGTLLQGGDLLDFVPAKERLKVLGSLRVVPELQKKIDDFCETNHFGKNVVGVHIRQTDAAIMNESHYLKKITAYLTKNPKQRFFICSDSSNVEKNFKYHLGENILLNPKKNPPLKIDGDDDWVTNKEGVEKYNVLRTENAMKEALIDLYLLGKSDFKIRSFGSFSNVGYYLSLINYYQDTDQLTMLTRGKVRYYTKYQKLKYLIEKIKYCR